MARSSIMNMTEGNTTSLLLKFAIPMLIGNLFQQFYNMVDAMVVGNYVSANALGAVGATGSLNFLFFSLSFGLASGIGIMVSQYFGAGDEEHVTKTIANAIYVLFSSAIIMSLAGVLLARPILVGLNTPAVILEDAVLYMQITCAGIVAISAYNGIAAILRALGDSKTPLMFLVVACFINIGLDLLFVITFQMGVMGVGVATLIAQAVAAIGCIIYALRTVSYFAFTKDDIKPEWRIIIKCFRIGIPVALQSSLIAISCIFLQMIINGFGEIVVSANTAVTRFEQLVQQPFASLGAALATYTGQNMGAGNLKRVKKGLASGTLLCLIFSLLMLPIAYFGGNGIMRLFVQDPEVIAFGSKALKITSLFYFFLGMIYVVRSILNGAGDTTYAMINGMVEITGRVGFAIPLTSIPKIGVWGIWYTTAFTWFITALVSMIRFAGGKWKTKRIAS